MNDKVLPVLTGTLGVVVAYYVYKKWNSSKINHIPGLMLLFSVELWNLFQINFINTVCSINRS